MNKLFFCLAMCWACASAVTAEDFQTNGKNNTYNFQTLAGIENSGVFKSGNTYVVKGTCTISQGDHFKIDEGAVVAFTDNARLVIQGTADLTTSLPTTLTKYGGASSCIGISVQNDAVTEVKNLNFEYVGLQGNTSAGMNVRSCHFSNHNGSISAALSLGADGATFHITDCTFDHCQKAAIGGAANYSCPTTIERCTFTHNSQANGNVPQLNLTAASHVTVSECTVEGDPSLTMVGGIAIANWFGYSGMKATVDHCLIKDNRYGITTMGIMDVDIIGNELIGNNHETNPDNGGSGISLYDPYLQQKAVITANRIEGNLWGITVIGCGDVNIGKTEVAEDADDYNPGMNVFKDNGNRDVLYDIYNNSTNKVYAQGNLWNVAQQDEKSIEEVVFHKNDNPSLGEVVFMPAGDPSAIHSAQAQRPADTRIFNIQGVQVGTGSYEALPRGLYIVNGKKIAR